MRDIVVKNDNDKNSKKNRDLKSTKKKKKNDFVKSFKQCLV